MFSAWRQVVASLFIVSLIIIQVAITPVVGGDRVVNRTNFQRAIGDRFNGSSASFTGFRSASLQAFFVGGSPEDSYSAHFILVANGTVATVLSEGQQAPSAILTRQIFIVSFPSVLFVSSTRRANPILFDNLNWTIQTVESQVGDTVRLRTQLSASLGMDADPGKNVSFSISLQSKSIHKPQKIPEIRIHNNSYSLAERSVPGEQVIVSLKMNHEFHGLGGMRYRNIILPIQIRIIQQALIPKKVFELNFRPSDFSSSEEVTNESSKPHIRLATPGLGALNYSWVPTVLVDGVSHPVRVQTAPLQKTARKGQFNGTHALFVRDWTIRKGLIYPYGNDVIHDPEIAVSMFMPAHTVVSLSPKGQAIALLLGLPLIIFVVLIFGKRKKYP